jgi:hypothetical protein
MDGRSRQHVARACTQDQTVAGPGCAQGLPSFARRTVAELDTSVFIIPGDEVKNAQDRLVVLNRVDKSVVAVQRGIHREYVFVYAPKPKKRKQRQLQREASPPKPLERMNGAARRGKPGVAQRQGESSEQVGEGTILLRRKSG